MGDVPCTYNPVQAYISCCRENRTFIDCMMNWLLKDWQKKPFNIEISIYYTVEKCLSFPDAD